MDEILRLDARDGGLGLDPNSRPESYKYIGIGLAVASGLFIGSSFVLKKIGLLRANEKYNEEAGQGYGYLKNMFWWAGMILMIIGEICNFVAYAFVDAILVTPLGALSVVVATVLSAIFLKERLSFVGKVGCFCCILGSVVIALNAPAQSAVSTIQQVKRLAVHPAFLAYAGVILVGCIAVAIFVAPKYGSKHMMVYLTICSLIGGLSVVATQGLGAAVVAEVEGTRQFNEWFLYVVLGFVIVTLLTEIIYLNKALNVFNAAVVTPTYYVYFTTSTFVASAVLFRGFKGSPIQIATVVMGFLEICAGVILLQLSKSSKDVPDATVFRGDLDQVRAVADQSRSNFEPGPDSIRAVSGVGRFISQGRRETEEKEGNRLIEENRATAAEAAAEGGSTYWDGIRNLKTVNFGPVTYCSNSSGAKFSHQALGPNLIPHNISDDPESELHPGFPMPASRKMGLAMPAPPTSKPKPQYNGIGTLAIANTSSARVQMPLAPGGYDDYNAGVDTTPFEPDGQDDTLHVPKHGPSQSRQFSFSDFFSRSGASLKSLSGSSHRKTGSRNWLGGRSEEDEECRGLVKADSEVLPPDFAFDYNSSASSQGSVKRKKTSKRNRYDPSVSSADTKVEYMPSSPPPLPKSLKPAKEPKYEPISADPKDIGPLHTPTKEKSPVVAKEPKRSIPAKIARKPGETPKPKPAESTPIAKPTSTARVKGPRELVKSSPRPARAPPIALPGENDKPKTRKKSPTKALEPPEPLLSRSVPRSPHPVAPFNSYSRRNRAPPQAALILEALERQRGSPALGVSSDTVDPIASSNTRKLEQKPLCEVDMESDLDEPDPLTTTAKHKDDASRQRRARRAERRQRAPPAPAGARASQLSFPVFI